MVNNRIYICYLLFLTACAEENTDIVFPKTTHLSVTNIYNNVDVYMRVKFLNVTATTIIGLAAIVGAVNFFN